MLSPNPHQTGFTATRARNDDPDTSKAAAVNAASVKACAERLAICRCLDAHPAGLTAMEVAKLTSIDYIEVQRRISECAGLEKTPERRDGRRVWRAIEKNA